MRSVGVEPLVQSGQSALEPLARWPQARCLYLQPAANLRVSFKKPHIFCGSFEVPAGDHWVGIPQKFGLGVFWTLQL